MMGLSLFGSVKMRETPGPVSFLAGVRRILPFGRRAAPVARPVDPAPAPPPEPDFGPDREKIQALGYFCGFLTAGGELYADAAAGAEAFAAATRLAKNPVICANLHEHFAQACLDGAHARHLRELDAFIHRLTLHELEIAEQLSNALRCVLAQEKRDAGFVYENGTQRSIDVFRKLLSMVRRAPEVFVTLTSPEGARLDLRGVESRLLDERLDHADKIANAPPEPEAEPEKPALNSAPTKRKSPAFSACRRN